MVKPISRTLEESKLWYIAAVKGNLVLNYGFMEDEASKIICAYKLRERLDIAPDAQLHMDIEDTTREMKREGFFKYGKRD